MMPPRLPCHLVAKAWALWHQGYDTQDIAQMIDRAEGEVYNTISALRFHLPSLSARAAEAGREADPSPVAKRGPSLSLVK